MSSLANSPHDPEPVPQAAPAKTEYLTLQVLRALAAILVVAQHAKDYLVDQHEAVPAALNWIHGVAGVDIFFVISGFVMMISCGRLLEQPNPARLFLLRRLIRIVPLYWLLTALKLILLLSHSSLVQHETTPWNAIASFLFLPSRAPYGEIRPLLPVGWTLSFEMTFYLFFAAALALAGRKLPRVLTFLTPAILALAVVGLVRVEAWPAITAIADPIVLEFLAGAWIAYLALRLRLPGRVPAAFGIALGFLGLILFDPTAIWQRPLLWGTSATLLILGAVALEGAIGSRIPRWLLTLGDASYSIYLIQTFLFPILHLAMARWTHDLVHRNPLAAGLLLMGLSIVLTSIAGVLLHRLVEKPITERLRRMIGVSRPRAVTP